MQKNKAVAFKNNAHFINCISKINGIKTDNAEDLDVVMAMHNLLEYSKNYKKTTGSLWNYCRDEPSNPLSCNSKSFKYKTSITGKTYNISAGEEGYDANKVGKNQTEVVTPLKHLINFWRSLNIPLITCEIELILTLNNPAIVPPAELEFKITDRKLYVTVVTLSKENDIKYLEQLKPRFKRTIKRTFFVPYVKIKDFNVIIDGKGFLYLPVKNEEETYEAVIDMSNNNDYTTGHLLDFAYFKENYKLIAVDLSKQTELKDPQQINFIGKLDKDNGATMFFIIEKSEETTFNFL